MENKELTYGQKLVGLKFNPSELTSVDVAKENLALEIDRMDLLRKTSESQEQKRLASTAITEIQRASMWVVKALTWED